MVNAHVGHDLILLALAGDTRSFKKLVDSVPTTVLNKPTTLDTIDGIAELSGLSQNVRHCLGRSNPKKVLIPLIVVISYIGNPRLVQIIIKRVDINANVIRDGIPRVSFRLGSNSGNRNRTFPNYMSIVEVLILSLDGPPNFPEERVRALRKIIRMLVERGLRLNHPPTPQNYSPLISAWIAGDVELFKLFVRHGADLSEDASEDGLGMETPYELIHFHRPGYGDARWIRVIKWLVDNGYAKKLSPLHTAVYYGNVQIVKYVLAKVYGGKVPTTRSWRGRQTVLDLVQKGCFVHFATKSAKKKIFDIITAPSRKATSNALYTKTNLPNELRQNILFKARLSRYRATDRRRNR